MSSVSREKAAISSTIISFPEAGCGIINDANCKDLSAPVFVNSYKLISWSYPGEPPRRIDNN